MDRIIFPLWGVNYSNPEFCKAFGKNLRRIRTEKGLGMREFALQADIEYSQLSRIELGTTNTTIVTAYSLAEALGVPVKELFDFKFQQKNKGK